MTDERFRRNEMIARITHSVPTTSSDERSHVLNGSCWCEPRFTGSLWQHYRPGPAEGDQTP